MAKKGNKKHKQNKPHGHYCKVCGEHKANEKFSGKGHASHICKKCSAMPVAQRNEQMAIIKIGNMAFRYLSKTEIKWLRGKMSDSRPDVREAARDAYNMKFSHYERDLDEITAIKTPVLFSKLDNDMKTEAIDRLEELIGGFFLVADYLPTDEDRDNILAELCEEMSDTLNQWEPEPYDPVAGFDPRFDFGSEYSFDEKIAMINEILEADAEDYDPYAEPEEPEPEPQRELIPDNELKETFDKMVAQFVAELKESDGIEFPTFMDTLVVAETERLKIRRFYKTDLDALTAIMSKPEVMYAWEEGFKKSETRKWLNHQYTRYHKDGYGYFAVTLKDSGKLIGQAGLMRQELNGENIVEIGYIFDNIYWGLGYAIEAARACIDMAFQRFGLSKVYATIRPENVASVKLAEKLGMRKVGALVKNYKDKEMPHDIYLLEKVQDD